MHGLTKFFRGKIKKASKKEFFSLVFSLLFLGYLAWLLFDTHILQEDIHGNLLTGESTYGDLPFHLSTISQLSYGNIFPPEHPLYAGQNLVYPYFINLLSAGLVLLGLSLRDAIIIPGIFLLLLTAELLYFFYKKISKDHVTALLATFLFWFNGGLGFYYFFKDSLKGGLAAFINDPGRFPDYTHLFLENIHWNNFLTRIVVPQRAVLLGIPAGIIILYLLFVKIRKSFKIDKELIAASILTGLLPFLHTHTFLSFLFIIPFLAFFEIERKNLKEWIRKWMVFAGVVFAVSSPWLISIFSHIGSVESFIRFHIGWMAEPGIVNFFLFWFKNAGILIPIMIIVLFAGFANTLTKKLTFAGLFVLLIVNLFLFQPFDWDNIKLLYWVSVFGALSASTLLVHVFRRFSILGKLVSVILFIGLTLSSYPSFYREIKLQHMLFGREEVLLGNWVREETEKESIFLTAPIHNSFVNNLGGRRILMGYPGLLWTQGIDFSERSVDIQKMYKGDKELIKRYNVSYIVLGHEERRVYEPDESFLDNNFELVKTSPNYKVYEVTDKQK